MGGFLAELGKKLAERWLSLLVLPGLLYLGALAAAYTLGHRHPFDVARITRQLDTWTTSPGVTSASGLVLVLLVGILAAAGVGLAAQALGSLTERVWLADRWQSWPPPFRHLAASRTTIREKRWTAATQNYQSQLDTKGAQRAGRVETLTGEDLGQARRAVTRIAQEEPTRPTWIGDRIHAAITRLDREYDLGLATIWPHLWLAMPETTRTEITSARESLARATTLAGWGLLYLIAGTLWWPGLLIAAAIIGTAWRRARTAADTYALLIEAAARLYTADLARSLGIDHTGPLNQRTGLALTCLLQGRSYLIPLTARQADAPVNDA
ncbi:MAG: hypothetical protein ACT4NY_02305 [Pseudonocardiales bacterium]